MGGSPAVASTSWRFDTSIHGSKTRTARPFTIGRVQQADGKPLRNVMSSKNPELMGLSFNPVDIYGSSSAPTTIHRPWGRKDPTEPDNYLTREGYGQVPLYLVAKQRQHLRQRPGSAASMGSLAAGSSTRGSPARPGTASSFQRPGSAASLRRPGSASTLSLGRGSTSGLEFSNATVRLIEHPLQWKFHRNGVNVRSSSRSNLQQQQSPQQQRPRPSSALSPSAFLKRGERLSSSPCRSVSWSAAAPTASSSADIMLSSPTKTRASPLCTTFGLLPEFARDGPDMEVFTRLETAGGGLIRKSSGMTLAPAPGTLQWRSAASRPFPQDASVRYDRDNHSGAGHSRARHAES